MMKGKFTKLSELSENHMNIVLELIDTSITISKETILLQHAFNPFAVQCDKNNNYGILGIDDELANDSFKAVNELRRILNESMNCGKYFAASLSYNVLIHDKHIQSKTDAICIDLKLSNIFQNRYLYPYKINNAQIEYLDASEYVVDNLF